ncbi:MAG: alpha/beta fold hydrolase [Rhodospirillaceae bacterium]
MTSALSHGRLHFSGDAPASALFVHGGFHGAWCWSQTLAFLAARNAAGAAIDLRGHGGLPQDGSFLSAGVDVMTQDVLEAMRKVSAPILVGHSLGALIAMKAATQVPLRGLILLAPAAPSGVTQGHPLPRFPAGHAVQPPARARARKWFMAGAAAPEMTSYLAQLCPESPALLNECFHDGVTIERAALSCPILCLSGAKDDSPLHPRGQDRLVAAHYGAALKIIEPSGHCLMLDDGWRETAAAIHTWMTAL